MPFLDNLTKFTVIVMDNASIHHAKIIQDRLPIWQKRGLFIFYLPPYSPHLNIIGAIVERSEGRLAQTMRLL